MCSSAVTSRATLTLKQFMLRQQVLKLYRHCLRTTNQVVDATQREELREWVRSDFRAYQNVSVAEEDKIRSLLIHGEKMLNEMKQSVQLSKA